MRADPVHLVDPGAEQPESSREPIYTGAAEELSVGLTCLFGHSWSQDCEKCSRCGLQRSQQHDWSGDCEKCSKCGASRSGQHDWSLDCGACSKCGATRTAPHDWAADCAKCSKCGATRGTPHNWDRDCEKCSECKVARSGAHDWDGCTCKTCGIVRNQDHAWEGCMCARCGKYVRPEGHKWKADTLTCSGCGAFADIPLRITKKNGELDYWFNDLLGLRRAISGSGISKLSTLWGKWGMSLDRSAAERLCGFLDRSSAVSSLSKKIEATSFHSEVREFFDAVPAEDRQGLCGFLRVVCNLWSFSPRFGPGEHRYPGKEHLLYAMLLWCANDPHDVYLYYIRAKYAELSQETATFLLDAYGLRPFVRESRHAGDDVVHRVILNQLAHVEEEFRRYGPTGGSLLAGRSLGRILEMYLLDDYPRESRVKFLRDLHERLEHSIAKSLQGTVERGLRL